jgi:hypothetical protein
MTLVKTACGSHPKGQRCPPSAAAADEHKLQTSHWSDALTKIKDVDRS